MATDFVWDQRKRDVQQLALDLRTSPKRILGWEPTETHDHFDAAGEFTGRTVVTREVEWDDRTLSSVMAYREFVAARCDCGFHPELIGHPDAFITSGERVCPVCQMVDRRQRELDDSDGSVERLLGEDASPRTARPGDGRKLYAYLMSPDEAAEHRQRR